MAVAFDAYSNSSSGTGNLSWTHTPVGTAAGVWVHVLQVGNATDQVTGVTYGGVAMTESALSPALYAGTESFAVYSYFLGSGIPAGAQTVVVSVNATGSTKQAGALSVTAAGDTALQDTDTVSGVVANISGTLLLSGYSSFCALAWMSGHNVPDNVTPLAGWTQRLETDYGTESGGCSSYDTVGTADVTYGLTNTALDILVLGVAISEVVDGGGGGGGGGGTPPSFTGTLSDAIREAYASAPADEIIYDTLEFRHPDFTVPIRVVRDVADLTATLEATAPVDPGAAVTFTGFAFDFTMPELGRAAAPEILISIDNVGREIMGYLDLAAQSADLIEVTYRPYLSSDLTAPQMDPPITLVVREVHADVFKIECRATYGDFANRRFPSETYDAQRFPGLIAS